MSRKATAKTTAVAVKKPAEVGYFDFLPNKKYLQQFVGGIITEHDESHSSHGFNYYGEIGRITAIRIESQDGRKIVVVDVSWRLLQDQNEGHWNNVETIPFGLPLQGDMRYWKENDYVDEIGSLQLRYRALGSNVVTLWPTHLEEKVQTYRISYPHFKKLDRAVELGRKITKRDLARFQKA